MPNDAIRVLLVDDSVVVRRAVAAGLAGASDLELLRPAPGGELALRRIPVERPDVVVLDVDMPGMDGLETLRQIRAADRHLPVIMFSAHTERGAAISLEALTLGASDCLPKPAAGATLSQDVLALLADKVRALARPRAAPPAVAPAATPAPPPPRPAAARRRVDLLVIGVSTGGPNALAELMPRLPGDFPVPVLIVQHMPPMFTQLLAQRLDARCALAVREGVADAAPAPGEVWIAPGDRHMVIRRGPSGLRLALDDGPPENSCRPAVDVLFRSAAEVHGDGVLALVLTGMGQDGLRGCEAVLAAGGQVVVQDEATSVVWGMPGIVARSGLADAVLPLAGIAGELLRRVRVGRPSFRSGEVQP